MRCTNRILTDWQGRKRFPFSGIMADAILNDKPLYMAGVMPDKETLLAAPVCGGRLYARIDFYTDPGTYGYGEEGGSCCCSATYDVAWTCEECKGETGYMPELPSSLSEIEDLLNDYVEKLP
jgi:hypothetical protein